MSGGATILTYYIPCTKCGEVVEREQETTPPVCFDCKNKRRKKNNGIEIDDIPDPRAKENCVLCERAIQQSKYLQNGNFCAFCIAECNTLSLMFPPPIHDGMTPEKKQRTEESMEFYERASKIFQDKCWSTKMGYQQRYDRV